MPGQFEGFGYRKILVQNQVEAAIEKKVRQVLVVGAGFDTICLRLAPQYAQLQFFEVDHPATSEVKCKGIVLEGQPANMVQIATDLGKLPLSRVLSEQNRWEAQDIGSANSVVKLGMPPTSQAYSGTTTPDDVNAYIIATYGQNTPEAKGEARKNNRKGIQDRRRVATDSRSDPRRGTHSRRPATKSDA